MENDHKVPQHKEHISSIQDVPSAFIRQQLLRPFSTVILVEKLSDIADAVDHLRRDIAAHHIEEIHPAIGAESSSASFSPPKIIGLDMEWVATKRTGAAAAIPLVLEATDYPTDKISLLQLCSWRRCVLFRLCCFRSGSENVTEDVQMAPLWKILSDPNILKVGVGIHGDQKKLMREYMINAHPCVDVGHLVMLQHPALSCDSAHDAGKRTVATEGLTDCEGRYETVAVPHRRIDTANITPYLSSYNMPSLSDLSRTLLGWTTPKDLTVTCSNWSQLKLAEAQIQYAVADAAASWATACAALAGVPYPLVEKNVTKTFDPKVVAATPRSNTSELQYFTFPCVECYTGTCEKGDSTLSCYEIEDGNNGAFVSWSVADDGQRALERIAALLHREIRGNNIPVHTKGSTVMSHEEQIKYREQMELVKQQQREKQLQKRNSLGYAGRKKRYYDNILCHAPNGEVVFSVSEEKAAWYVFKQQIADVIKWINPHDEEKSAEELDPSELERAREQGHIVEAVKTDDDSLQPPLVDLRGLGYKLSAIRLQFEPAVHKGDAALRPSDEFFRSEKPNHCVVCGAQDLHETNRREKTLKPDNRVHKQCENPGRDDSVSPSLHAAGLVRFFVVPQAYRKHFPAQMVSHSFDIVLVCTRCMPRVQQLYDTERKVLSREYKAPLTLQQCKKSTLYKNSSHREEADNDGDAHVDDGDVYGHMRRVMDLVRAAGTLIAYDATTRDPRYKGMMTRKKGEEHVSLETSKGSESYHTNWPESHPTKRTQKGTVIRLWKPTHLPEGRLRQMLKEVEKGFREYSWPDNVDSAAIEVNPRQEVENSKRSKGAFNRKPRSKKSRGTPPDGYECRVCGGVDHYIEDCYCCSAGSVAAEQSAQLGEQSDSIQSTHESAWLDDVVALRLQNLDYSETSLLSADDQDFTWRMLRRMAAARSDSARSRVKMCPNASDASVEVGDSVVNPNVACGEQSTATTTSETIALPASHFEYVVRAVMAEGDQHGSLPKQLRETNVEELSRCTLSALCRFIYRWRTYFLKSVQPKFMPPTWTAEQGLVLEP